MKKVICLVLSMIMVVSFGVTTIAEDDKGLTNAILAVKSIINVPEGYLNFKYSYSENEEMGQKIWELRWYDKYTYDGIAAMVTEDGTLIYYENYRSESNSDVLSKVTHQEGQTYVNEFLAKVFPDNWQDFKLAGKKILAQGSEFRYFLQRFVNGIPVYEEKVSVSINKFTGEVVGYSGCLLYDGEYPAAEKIIGLDTAKYEYLSKLGLKMQYALKYDYENKTITPYVVYIRKNNKNKAIDAFTGNVIDFGDGRGVLYYESQSANLDAAKGSLSDIEQTAVNDVKGLISKDVAIENVMKYVEIDYDTHVATHSELYQNEFYKDEYTWQFGIDLKKGEESTSGIFAKVDAVSGRVLEYMIYSYEQPSEAIVTEQDADEKVKNFVQKLLTEEEQEYMIFEKTDTDENEIYKDSNLRYYTYTRYANGIAVEGQSVNVTYDLSMGMISNFNININKHLQFPSLENVMSQTKIMDNMATACEFKIMYKNTADGKKGLMYDFEDKSNMTFDAVTGNQLDRNGNKVIEEVIPEYADIAGHWCESVVRNLLENGIYIPDTVSFNPSMEITQYEFLRYLMTQQYANSSQEDFYKYITSRGIITLEEQNPAGSVTRAEAVIFVIRLLGYEKVAKYSNIYNYPFKDNIAEEFKGYVTLAHAMKIIKGDQDGNFNPNNPLTRAESAMIVYNTLLA